MMHSKKLNTVNKESTRIEVCGGIASGKTTFASLLTRHDFHVIYEDFTNNPFWGAFYSNPIKYAFETEITFTLQHYHQIKSLADTSNNIACDYSFLLDMGYAQMGLGGSQLEAFNTIYEVIQKELPPPELLIHLQCDPEVELARIHARGRDVEKNITVDFLIALNDALSEQIEKVNDHIPILTIDSAKNNFVEDEDVKRELLQMVTETLPIRHAGQ